MKKTILFLFLFLGVIYAQESLYSLDNPDSAKFSFADFGNMWTFDAVPADSFRARYNFEPSEEWLARAMRSALQFGSGCSGAFVSADGLIMTNHHCGRNKLREIQKENENLLRDGFYAPALEDERKVPGLYVDQLITIKDVTNRVLDAYDSGETAKEKIELRNREIEKIEKEYSEKTGLICKTVALYNGKKFSLYIYKRYDDIRLVMSPDFQIAATGWDWDNFTYPRYELDFMFFRAYENGKPVKTEYYFPVASEPVTENEAVFVIGRPGHTDRHISVAELNYLKNHVYKQRLIKYDALYKAYFYLFENCKDTTRHSELLNAVMGFGNGRKSYAGRLLGLRNRRLIAKKKDFEKQLRKAVNENPSLKKRYGEIWNNIDSIITALSRISDKFAAYTLSPFYAPAYLQTASRLRGRLNGETDFDEEKANTVASEIVPENLDEKYEREKNLKLTEAFLKIYAELIPDEKLTRMLISDKQNLEKSAREIIERSMFATRSKALETIRKALLAGVLPEDDPFMKIITISEKKAKELRSEMQTLKGALAVQNQLLSSAVTEIYGDVIPPDATLTLRISDGRIKGYEYNGTLAPPKTSFYGLWDRYVSFGKKEYPWGLHERWQTPPKELNLETPIGFASTNDIVGGNSGSSVINRNGEVVGLVHDGNLESLAGHFIFDPTNNRAVSSDIFGILEALKYVYKTPKLVYELKNGELYE